MTTATSRLRPELTGQTVVVIGGGAGIGLHTARGTRCRGAGIVLTGGNTNPAALGWFLGGPPEHSGHVRVTAAGPAFG